MILRHAGLNVLWTTWCVAMWLQTYGPGPGSLDRCSISGVVVDADVRGILEGATVTVSGDGLTGQVTATTGDDGRFVFKDLPAGRFIVRASKPTFLATAYGALSPEGPGVPVVLGTSLAAENVSISLYHGATIRGRILDSEGRPASDVSVIVSRSGGNGSKAGVVRSVTTNGLGEYVASGLPEGLLIVAAVAVTSADGAVSRSPAQMDVLRSVGARPGVPAITKGADSISTVYNDVPTFYPGTIDAAQASPVATTVNQERAGIDFSLAATALPTIEGVVERANGLPIASCDIGIQSEDSAGIGDNFAPVLSQSESGHFRFSRVLPGRYLIRARSSTGSARTDSIDEVEWASTSVVATGTSATEVLLALRPAANVAGRVQWDSQVGVEPPIIDTHIDLVLPAASRPVDLERTLVSAETVVATTQLQTDGSFSFTGIPPGRYQLRPSVATGRNTTWWARSASSGGRNDLNAIIDVGAIAVDDILLSLSSRHSQLVGILQTAAGEPWSSVVIVVFPVDRGLWTSNSALVQTARPGSDGSFVFKDLAAGPYILAAADEIAPDGTTGSFLEELARTGVRVSVRDGERTTQNLRMSRLVQPGS
jgi:hypothetical protein